MVLSRIYFFQANHRRQTSWRHVPLSLCHIYLWLVRKMKSLGHCCNTILTWTSIFLYADDIMLISPLPACFKLCYTWITRSGNMFLNVKKIRLHAFWAPRQRYLRQITNTWRRPACMCWHLPLSQRLLSSARTFKCCFDNCKSSFYRSLDYIYGRLGHCASPELCIYCHRKVCQSCYTCRLLPCKRHWTTLAWSLSIYGIYENVQYILRIWNNPVVTSNFTDLLSTCTSPVEKARLILVTAPHAWDWLNAPPITAVDLHLFDEAIWVEVGLRLRSTICQRHTWIYDKSVDARGLHGISCRKSGTRHIRHSQLNDLIRRAIKKVRIPATKEPVDLSRTDEKRPNGATLIPWIRGKPLALVVTVSDTYSQTLIGETAEQQQRWQQLTRQQNMPALQQRTTSFR